MRYQEVQNLLGSCEAVPLGLCKRGFLVPPVEGIGSKLPFQNRKRF
jgi:hypothetical protein